MNKKGTEETTPKGLTEIIGGVLVSGIIIFILAVSLSSGSTTVIDNANIKAQNFLASSLAYTMNKNLSGGEHTIGAWNFYSGSDNIVYAIVYLPQESAAFILDAWVLSDAIPISFMYHLDTKSIDKMEKCLMPDEACFCLFKLDYKDTGRIPDKNVITVSVNSPADPTLYSSVYDYEMDTINSWIKSNFIYALIYTDVKAVSILDCVPMKEKGCTYLAEDGTSKACIPHYGSLSEVKPVVWINTKAGNPLSIETTTFDAAEYNNIPASAYLDSPGVFPRIKKFYEQYTANVDPGVVMREVSTEKDAVQVGVDTSAKKM